ncbi:MAG: YigZ family protein [Bacteroidales bacterium]|nr:YigZ family protein [Bacteroidales bacterium]
MLCEDTYKTIEKVSEGIYKEKGSKFISFAFPVIDEKDVKSKIEELRKEYHDARHYCYAYRLGFDKSIYRVNDDGEPSGTAGRPIYGQIVSKDLTNIMVVVVRYFGGTKLGVSGLINAYKTATKEALDNAQIITKTIQDIYQVNFDYESMNDVMKIIKEENINQIFHSFDLKCVIKFSVRKNNSNKVFKRFSKIKNLRINYLHTE